MKQPSVIVIEDNGRRDKRVRILVSGEVLLETSRDVLRSAAIDAETEWDQEELVERIRSMEHIVAKERALRLLGHSERTRCDLQQRLESEGLSSSSVDAALERLEAVGALSDDRFAEMFVRAKMFAGWGRPRIERILIEKGVSPHIYSPYLEEYVPEAGEKARARKLVATRDLSTPRERERALGLLARRGFAPSNALSVVKESPIES